MWLENIKELKKRSGLSSKQIAEKANLPERTVMRIFSGETPNPYLDTLQRIVVILGGSLDDVLADSKTVLGSKSLATLQAELDKLNGDLAVLAEENIILKNKLSVLTAENELLNTKLAQKDEIIAVHNYYGTLISGLAKGNSKKHGHN